MYIRTSPALTWYFFSTGTLILFRTSDWHERKNVVNNYGVNLVPFENFNSER